jgi:hypothetical protein
MQHANQAATVDIQHCADFILDAVEAIEHCFNGSRARFPRPILVAMRVVRLLSTGDPAQATTQAVHRAAFVQAMQIHHWRGPNTKPPKKNEAIFQPGNQDTWGMVIWREPGTIDGLLNQVGAAAYP